MSELAQKIVSLVAQKYGKSGIILCLYSIDKGDDRGLPMEGSMDEKLMSLSFSMESNKGGYTLLLGSGIPYSAVIPTGWGILRLLCARIMELEGEDYPDEIECYTKKFGKEPLYGETIGMLAKPPVERNGLLSEFFKLSEEDIQENRKVPTEAHRSIASLVRQGYIEVIITANFDRLLEQSCTVSNTLS